MTTGTRIGVLREEKNITQVELAEKLNVSRQTISKWECDICLPEIPRLIELAELFNVSVDYLLGVETVASFSADESSGKSMRNNYFKIMDNYKKTLLSLIVLLLSFIINFIIFISKRVYIIENDIVVGEMNFFQTVFSGLVIELTISVFISLIISIITVMLFNYERKNK